MAERIVLVTGATGYIGSVLVPLLAREYRVRAVDTEHFGNAIADTPNTEFIKADIQDIDAMLRAMAGVSHVIHLAGIVTDELVDMNPLLAMKVNLLGTMNVMRAALRHNGVQRFIYASSSSIYGLQDVVATIETPPKPMTIYAMTKLLGEQIVLDCAKNQAIQPIIVRCATCCGPAPRMRMDTIVNVFSKQAYFDHQITVHGGGQWRTNVHVQDVAELYRSLLQDRVFPTIGNMTSGNHRAIELATMVTQVAHENAIPCNMIVDTTKVDRRNYLMHSSWTTQKSIREAIEDNFRFFASGKVSNPDDDIWYNTRRMAPLMKG